MVKLKIDKMTYISFVIVIIITGIISVRYIESRSNENNLSDNEIKYIAEQLPLISYKNNYGEIINLLPKSISSEVKTLLKQDTTTKYLENSIHGDIKKLDISILSSNVIRNKNRILAFVNTNEINLFNSNIITFVEFEVKGGNIIEIKVNDYTNDNDSFID